MGKIGLWKVVKIVYVVVSVIVLFYYENLSDFLDINSFWVFVTNLFGIAVVAYFSSGKLSSIETEELELLNMESDEETFGFH